jgi:hypothetical protein
VDAPKPEDKKPDAAPEPKVEPKAPEPKSEDEDEDLKAIQPKKNAHPEVHNGFKALKGIIKTERQTTAQLRQEIEQLKQQSATAKPLDEATQKELESLRTFHRRLKNIEADPEFTAKYDGVIKTETEALVKQLESMKLPKADCEKMLAEGLFNKTHDQAWWNQKVFTPLTKQGQILAAQNIAAVLSKVQGLGQERTTAIQKAAEDFKGYESQQQQKQEAFWKSWGEKAEAEGKKVIQELPDWARPKEVPANATPEVRKSIEDHNDFFEKMKAAVQENVTKINSVDPATITRAAISMVALEKIKKDFDASQVELQKAKAEAEELRGKLAKISQAGRVASKESAPVAAAKPTEKTLKQVSNMTAEEAWDEYSQNR